MKNYPNIDKSGFHRGEYVGYSKFGTWRIVKHQCGWSAILRSGSIVTNLPFAPVLIEKTIGEISAKLTIF
jgi:hypothetical protein